MGSTLKTQKIYWEKPYLREITAKIVDISSDGLLLDKTILYPGGGGQDRDFGTIKTTDGMEYEVIGIDKVGQGFYHNVKGEPPKLFQVGEKVKLVVDWDRRYAHMRAHSSQHVFSAYLLASSTSSGLLISKTVVFEPSGLSTILGI